MLETALLAIPAGIVGFIAAPCCGLLGPAYLPFALNTTTVSPPPSGIRTLALTDTSAESSAVATQAVPQTASRTGTLVSFTAFAAGFCVFFTLLGVSASALGTLLLEQLPVLEKVAGIFILAVGAAMLIRLRFVLPGTTRCVESKRLRRGIVSPFLMGFSMAVVWTPCTGPTLGAILALAITTHTMWQGGALLFLYAVGLTIPFGLMALALGKAQRLRRFQARHEATLERIGGAVMIAVGALILLGGWQRWLGPLTAWLNSHGWPPV